MIFRQNTYSNSRCGDLNLATSFTLGTIWISIMTYIIFNNDLEDDISSKVLKFADETEVLFRLKKTMIKKGGKRNQWKKVVFPARNWQR